MKKKILVCLCLCASPLLMGVGSSFAADVLSTQAATGGVVTLGTAPNQLTYNPSPSVSMAVAAAANAYAIQSTNLVTDTTNGMDYGTLNTATGFAQMTKTEAATVAVTPPTSSAALSGTGWVWMGGSGGS
jgi:hypothetical protein